VATAAWNGFVVGPGTAVNGIDLLWPGRLLELDDAGKEVRQEDFWCIPDHAPRLAMDEDGLAAILEEGVRLHLASDVPLAVFVSGGVDSSVVANLAQRAAKSPIHTFTLAFEEQELNEGCQWAAKSPHFWASKIPQFGGAVISRWGDRCLRSWAGGRGAWVAG
jgi:asparagine synthase (glutamine-hydrolysing)